MPESTHTWLLGPCWSQLSWLMLSFLHAWLLLCPSPAFCSVSFPFLPIYHPLHPAPPHLLLGDFLLKYVLPVLQVPVHLPSPNPSQLIWVHSSLLLDSVFLFLRAVVFEVWSLNPQHQHHHYQGLVRNGNSEAPQNASRIIIQTLNWAR